MGRNKKPILVTEPFLPPIEEYFGYLKGIWERNWLTNQGPLVQEFEQKLQDYHQIQMPVHCVANGSLGLQIILKALGVKGEVITTPFSYVATSACPLWEGCSIKFADIDAVHLTVDPLAVEAAITPQTEAILATHVFGNPCDCEALDAIARKHGLAMIYDAAHAFGVRYKGKSILEYGDASMVSLHATKLIHSIEGGFIVARDCAVAEKLEWMRRFGHKAAEDFYGIGMNAKMSEFHAAMGLANLNHVGSILQHRKAICDAYDEHLRLNQLSQAMHQLSALSFRKNASRNYAYFPVLYGSENQLLAALNHFEAFWVFPRRYFYPSLDHVFTSDQSGSCEISRSVAKRILCLPLSAGLAKEDLGRVLNAFLKQ